jgi:hypothetical protein
VRWLRDLFVYQPAIGESERFWHDSQLDFFHSELAKTDPEQATKLAMEALKRLRSILNDL